MRPLLTCWWLLIAVLAVAQPPKKVILDGSRKQRAIWDLSLIGAMIHEETSKEMEVLAPKNMGHRKVHYFVEIDATTIMEDFYSTLVAFLEQE